MLICGFCGADLRAKDCGCRAAQSSDPRERSHLLDVVRTAAALGGVSAETIERASRALREEPS